MSLMYNIRTPDGWLVGCLDRTSVDRTMEEVSGKKKLMHFEGSPSKVCFVFTEGGSYGNRNVRVIYKPGYFIELYEVPED